jgi:drug/metabolite transporter (DMT)-like permease
MASVFTALSLLYTILLGFIILGEPVTRSIIAGSVLIIVGPALLAWPQNAGKRRTESENSDKPRVSGKGIIAALMMSVFFGISPLFIKLGLAEGGSALAGIFVSYSSATLIFGVSMIRRERRNAIISMEPQAMVWFVVSGFLVSVAQLFRYIALKSIPITVAGPLIATIPVFMVVLSFIVNRRIETFRPNVIVGAILVVLGTALVYR